MKRYVIIAIVWLLPPLLFAAESLSTRHGHPTGKILALITAVFSLISAAVALMSKPRSATPLSFSRFMAATAILVVAPIAAILLMMLQRAAIPHWLAISGGVLLVAWFCSMPLWGALLFWRPNIRLLSASFAMAVVTSALPYYLSTTGPIGGVVYGSPPSITSPTGGATF